MKILANAVCLSVFFLLAICFGCKPNTEANPEAKESEGNGKHRLNNSPTRITSNTNTVVGYVTNIVPSPISTNTAKETETQTAAAAAKSDQGPDKITISGSVSVVSRDGANHNLGRLRIDVYELNEFTTYAAAKSHEALTVENKFQELLKKVNRDLYSYNETNQILSKQFKNMSDKAQKQLELANRERTGSQRDLYIEENQKCRAALRQIINQQETNNKQGKIAREYKTRLMQSYRQEIAEAYLPCPLKPISFAETDANGKYTIEIPDNISDVAFLGRGKIQVGEETERCNWMIKAKLKDYSDKPLLLSNNNMLPDGDPNTFAVQLEYSPSMGDVRPK